MSQAPAETIVRMLIASGGAREYWMGGGSVFHGTAPEWTSDFRPVLQSTAAGTLSVSEPLRLQNCLASATPDRETDRITDAHPSPSERHHGRCTPVDDTALKRRQRGQNRPEGRNLTTPLPSGRLPKINKRSVSGSCRLTSQISLLRADVPGNSRAEGSGPTSRATQRPAELTAAGMRLTATYSSATKPRLQKYWVHLAAANANIRHSR